MISTWSVCRTVRFTYPGYRRHGRARSKPSANFGDAGAVDSHVHSAVEVQGTLKEGIHGIIVGDVDVDIGRPLGLLPVLGSNLINNPSPFGVV